MLMLINVMCNVNNVNNPAILYLTILKYCKINNISFFVLKNCTLSYRFGSTRILLYFLFLNAVISLLIFLYCPR